MKTILVFLSLILGTQVSYANHLNVTPTVQSLEKSYKACEDYGFSFTWEISYCKKGVDSLYIYSEINETSVLEVVEEAKIFSKENGLKKETYLAVEVGAKKALIYAKLINYCQ